MARLVLRAVDKSTMAIEGVAAPPPKRRLLLGAGVFILGWVVTIAAASIVRVSTLPPAIVPIVVFIGPKLGVLATIAILGKPGFAYLKGLVAGYLTPPAEVSPARHRVGIVMFASAMLLSALEPYARVILPDFATPVHLALSADLLLLVSILVLGGDFWDKVRALFFREAKARFP